MEEKRNKLDRRPTPEARDPEMVVYNYLFAAFERFAPQGQAIDEESVIRLCLAANCPRREVALGVIENMVKKGLLTRQVDQVTQQRSYHIPKAQA